MMRSASMWMGLIAMVVGGMLVACATTQPPTELTEARAEYREASKTAMAEQNPQELQEAKQALEEAEEAWEEHGDSEVTRQRAREAYQKARMIQSRAAAQKAGEEATEAMREGTRDLEEAGEEATDEAGRLQAERQMNRAAQQLRQAGDVTQSDKGLSLWISSGKLFQQESTDLQPEAERRLDRVVEALESMPDHKAKIIGESRQMEGDEADRAQQRAESVRSYLIEQGITEDRVKTKQASETKGLPGADQATAEDGVRIHIYSKDDKKSGKSHGEGMEEYERMDEPQPMERGDEDY